MKELRSSDKMDKKFERVLLYSNMPLALSIILVNSSENNVQTTNYKKSANDRFVDSLEL